MTNPNRAAQVGKKAPWPKGKPRNEPDPRWKALRKRVAKALSYPDRGGEAGTNVRSAVYIAIQCGVNPSTVSKWLRGKRNPPTSAVTIMQQWLGTTK